MVGGNPALWRKLAGGAVVPAGATAVACNITLDAAEAPGGYLAFTPGGPASFSASTINWHQAGQIIANGAILELDANCDFKVLSGAGATHFLVDITGCYLY